MAVQLSSLRVSADFDPTKYTAGMNAKIAADRAGATSSNQVGQAITQTQQKVSAAGDPLSRLSRQYVEGFRATEQFNRAVTTLGRGIETGNIPLQRAGTILDGIYRKYGMTANAAELAQRGQISLSQAVNAANARFAEQANQLDAVTAAAIRATAANDNMRFSNNSAGGNAQTANIAAQFQDIGVTAAMGMSPIMIALQQGTQLSAALGNQGLRGTVLALGGAFASVLSPVSLLTIGVIALGSVGIQSLMGIGDSAADATSALEDHKKWLDQILVGYEAAADAANETRERAEMLPRGVVNSDLLASLKEQEAAAVALQVKIDGARDSLTQFLQDARSPAGAMSLGADFGSDAFASIVRQAQALRDLSLSTSSTTDELERAQVAARELYNTTKDPAIKQMADEVYGLARELAGLRGEIDSTNAAMSAMQIDAMISGSFSQLKGLGDAMDALKGMTPDLRSQAQRAQDVYDANSGSDASGELKRQLDYTLAQIKAEENLRASRRGEKSGAKAFNQWDNANDNFQQRTDGVRLEMEAIGQSTFGAERNKAAFDLLNQAKQAGVPITAALTGQINAMAGEYATAQVELTRMQEAQRLASEQMEFYRGTIGSFFTTFAQGIREGAGLWDSFANAAGKALDSIADRALSMAANGIFDMIFGAVMGGLTGGFGGSIAGGASIPAGGFIPGMTGPRLFATGTPSAPPGMAWVGEEGPELVKFKGGQRVYSHQTSMGMAANQNTPAAANNNGMLVQIIDQRKRGGSIEQQSAAGPNGEKQLRLFIRDEVRDARRRGAVGF